MSSVMSVLTLLRQSCSSHCCDDGVCSTLGSTIPGGIQTDAAINPGGSLHAFTQQRTTQGSHAQGMPT
jgi:hypothetical protein